MQKPKNLLPGLFLCVFSRIAEPLVDFYCSNLLAFPPFLFGADFFCRKERCFRPLLYRPFLHATPIKHAVLFCAIRPHERPLTKNPGTSSAPERALGNSHPKGSAHAAPLQTCGSIWHTAAPKRAPMQKPGEGAGAPQKSHAKTPGVIPGVLVEKFI